MNLEERVVRVGRVQDRLKQWTALPITHDERWWKMKEAESWLLLKRAVGLWWAVIRGKE